MKKFVCTVCGYVYEELLEKYEKDYEPEYESEFEEQCKGRY